MLSIIFGILFVVSWLLKAPLWVSLLFLIAGVLTNPTFHGDKKYKKALKSEQHKAYKEACRLYVEAILEGSMASKECKKRFLRLWNEFGPFDYQKDIKEKTEESIREIEREGDTPEDCGKAGLSVWVREQDAFLQMIDVLLGNKERIEPLREVVLFGKKWEFKSAGPALKVTHSKE